MSARISYSWWQHPFRDRQRILAIWPARVGDGQARRLAAANTAAAISCWVMIAILVMWLISTVTAFVIGVSATGSVGPGLRWALSSWAVWFLSFLVSRGLILRRQFVLARTQRLAVAA